MDDNGRLTGWTAFLILASIGLAFAGGWLAPDRSLPVWLLVGAWAAAVTAGNNIYRKVREKVRERQIREEERQRLGRREQSR